MPNSTTKRFKNIMEDGEAEDALLRANRKMSFVTAGLLQNANGWDEESIDGLLFILHDIDNHITTVREWFYRKAGE